MSNLKLMWEREEVRESVLAGLTTMSIWVGTWVLAYAIRGG
jgi:hypothetical protein